MRSIGRGTCSTCWAGRELADSFFDQAIARLTRQRDAELRVAAGFAVAPLVLSFSALNQWFLGYHERALARSAKAVAGALERGDLYGRAFASALGSMTLFLLRSDAAALQERAGSAQRVSQREGFAWWQAYSEVFLGWLALMSEDPYRDQGIERMQSAIAKWQATGMVIGTDSLLTVLADGCLAAERRGRSAGRPETAVDRGMPGGRLALGLAAIEPYLDPQVACGQIYQAELNRMRGELLLARDGLAAAGEALACFGRALEIGREQGALAWELRAAMSIVRLRQRQGEAYAAELAEARNCLADVYGRFTEGSTFPDLQDAAALIGNHPAHPLAS